MKSKLGISLRIKTLLLLLMSFMYTDNIMAQQLPIFSQLEMISQLYQPASIDTSTKVLKLNLSYRNQWSKFELPNRTFLIRAVKLFSAQNLSISVSMLSDQIGFTQRNGFIGSAAYKLNLTEETFISLGMGSSIEQFNFDESEVRADPDNLLENIPDKQYYLSINSGVSLHINGFQLGVSMININDTKIENQYYNTELLCNGFASYLWSINEQLDLNTALWYKTNLSTQHQLSALFKTSYNNNLSLSLGAHGDAAIIIGIGAKVAHKMEIQLFYDYQRTIERTISGETLELGISYLFR